MNNTANRLRYLRVLVQADFLVLLRSTRAMFASILAPVYILVISRSDKAQGRLGGSHFLVALAVTMGLLSLALVAYTLNIARDRERGVFQRLRVTPAPTWTIMASRILVQVIVGEVITLAVLIVSSRMNHIVLNPSEYIFTLLVALLEAAVFLSIGQALVGLVRSATTVAAAGSFLYAALLLTGLLGVSGVLGSTFQTFSKWTPVGTIMAVFQGALHQAPWDGHSWLSLLACFGYIVVFAGIGIKWFRWDAQ